MAIFFPFLSTLLFKIIPSNTLYPPFTYRKAKRKNLNYFLDISDYQEWLIYFDCPVDSSLEVIDYCKPGDVVIDIGANVGQTVLNMAKKVQPDGHALGFEPHPVTFEKLKKNIEMNPAIKNISIEKCGIGDTEEIKIMHQDFQKNSGGYRIIQQIEQAKNKTTEITTVTLDSYLENKFPKKKPDLIKIDVEGYEMNVIRGADITLKKHKPKLYVEVDNKNLSGHGFSSTQLIAHIEKYDYTIINCNSKNKISSVNMPDEGHFDIFCY